MLTNNERRKCESTFLNEKFVIDLFERYEEVDSYIANQILRVTPCFFEGEIKLRGERGKFFWYPSGYAYFEHGNGVARKVEYYICPGNNDEENGYICDERHELSELR